MLRSLLVFAAHADSAEASLYLLRSFSCAQRLVKYSKSLIPRTHRSASTPIAEVPVHVAFTATPNEYQDICDEGSHCECHTDFRYRQLILDNLTLVPVEARNHVLASLTSKQAYLVIIQDRSNSRFLENLRQYAALNTRDDAIEFFWRFNQQQIEDCLTEETVQLYWFNSGLSIGVRDSGMLELALAPLRSVALQYLGLRAKLLSWVKNGKLLMDQTRVDQAYKAIGLLASTDLTQLTLSNTSIDDVSPLSSLVNLQRLFLNSCPVKDISGLSSLINLQSLSLWRTDVENVYPLSSLVNLQELNLGETKVKEISPLSSLTNLKKLMLNNTKVKKLSGLSSLGSLEILSLWRTDVDNLSDLSSLMNLQELFLGDTQATDVFSLSRLSNLQRLDLSETHIKSVSPLSTLVNLKLLELSKNKVIDVLKLEKSLQTLEVVYH